MNNPLVYTDPDGEFIWFVIGGAIVGAYIGGGLAATEEGFNWNPFGGEKGGWKGTDWWKGAIVFRIEENTRTQKCRSVHEKECSSNR